LFAGRAIQEITDGITGNYGSWGLAQLWRAAFALPAEYPHLCIAPSKLCRRNGPGVPRNACASARPFRETVSVSRFLFGPCCEDRAVAGARSEYGHRNRE